MAVDAAQREEILKELIEDITETLQSDDLKCVSCKRTLKEPRHLPCRHVLCLNCFKGETSGASGLSNVAKRKSKDKKRTCPVKGCSTLYDPLDSKSALDINLGRAMRFFGELKTFLKDHAGNESMESLKLPEDKENVVQIETKVLSSSTDTVADENSRDSLTSGTSTSSSMSTSMLSTSQALGKLAGGEKETTASSSKDKSGKATKTATDSKEEENRPNSTESKSGKESGKKSNTKLPAKSKALERNKTDDEERISTDNARPSSEKKAPKGRGSGLKKQNSVQELAAAVQSSDKDDKLKQKNADVIEMPPPPKPAPKNAVSTSPPKENTSKLNASSTNHHGPNNIDKKNSKGETKLQLACKKKTGSLEEVRKLLELGANPNVSDNAGWTPLHEAAQRGDAAVIEALIEKGANVNVKASADGTTPLHDAVYNGQLTAVEALIKAGANPYVQDFNRKSSFDICRHNEIRAALNKTQCESDAEALNASNVSVTSPSEEAKPVVFALSGFKSAEICDYGKRVASSGTLTGRYADKVEPGVTHLVVTTLEEDEKVCGRRSLKFLQALANGCWVVGKKWLDESLKSGNWLSEIDYEVEGCFHSNPHSLGPKLARVSHQSQNEPSLFAGCGIYFQGKFKDGASIELKNLQSLAEWLGAKVLKREPRPKLSLSALGLKSPPVYHAPDGSDLKEYNVFIVRDPGLSPLSPGLQIRQAPLATVTYDWFLSCVEVWRLLELPKLN